METRLYEVYDEATKQSRLVDASSDGHALIHTLRPEIKVSIPSAKRVGELVVAGVKIEKVQPKRKKAE